MKAQVLCRVKPGQTATFPLHGEEAILGRESGLAVALTREGVSRHHAKIVFDGKNYWLEDLKSTNGTFLNGLGVERDKLRHLDVISLGKKVDLLFVLRTEETPPPRRMGVLRASLQPQGEGSLPIEIALGEMTLGRSTAANVVCENASVSKVHARIERTSEQLLIHDLGSANGTFVNGERIVAQALKHGDLISLAGAEAFRLSVETGEIEGPQEQPVTPTPKPGTLDRPRFKSDWKTRLEWDSLELRALAAIRGGAAPAPGSAAAADATLLPGRKADKAPPTKPAPARPELSQPVPPAASPARPTAPVKAAAPTADDEPPTIMASGKTAPRPAAPRPAAPPARPAAPPAPIRQVRLSAPGIEFTVAEPGPHELGRAQDATLRVTSATVSRRHARIVLGEDRAAAFVQDLGGANGTHCNGERVEGLRPLADGDVISIGELALRVRIVRD